MYSEPAKKPSPSTPPMRTPTKDGTLARDIAWFEAKVKKAKRTGKMHSEARKVSPAFAKWLLEKHNVNNRGLRRRKINTYKNDIISGKWILHSQGVSVTDTGQVNNGQHRYTAIVETDCPAELYFTFGERREAYDVIDTNGTRGGADTLHVIGYKNANHLASAIRLLHTICTSPGLHNVVIPNHEIGDLCKKYSGIENCVPFGKRIQNKLRCGSAPMTVAAYFISKGSHAARLNDFFSLLVQGNVARSRSPILFLRDALLSKRLTTSNGTNSGVRIAATAILTWNRWVTGKSASIGELDWTDKKEFPVAL